MEQKITWPRVPTRPFKSCNIILSRFWAREMVCLCYKAPKNELITETKHVTLRGLFGLFRLISISHNTTTCDCGQGGEEGGRSLSKDGKARWVNPPRNDHSSNRSWSQKPKRFLIPKLYRLVQKKGPVLLSTSQAQRGRTFLQLVSLSFAQPCK